jgi:hypothetical protein
LPVRILHPFVWAGVAVAIALNGQPGVVCPFSGGFQFVGALAPLAQHCAILVVFWYLCYFLCRHRIFLKL